MLSAARVDILIFFFTPQRILHSCSHGMQSSSQTCVDLQGCDSFHQTQFCKQPLQKSLHSVEIEIAQICRIPPDSKVQVVSD